MTEELLQKLIVAFDAQIKLLQAGKIQELASWQKQEKQLVEQLEQCLDISEISINTQQLFKKKLKKKHYLVEYHLALSKKLLNVLSSDNANLYNSSGTTANKGYITIMNKKI